MEKLLDVPLQDSSTGIPFLKPKFYFLGAVVLWPQLSIYTALSENTLNIPKSFFASHISNQSLIIFSLLSISQRLPCQFNISVSLSCSNSITSKMPQFRASQIRTSVSMLMFLPLPMLAIIFVVRPAAIRNVHLSSYCAQPACARGVYSLCAFILLPFSRFWGFCSHYIKVLAIPQIFLDTTAGSVWIVLFLSFLDYIYLAISCLMPCDFAAGLSDP